MSDSFERYVKNTSAFSKEEVLSLHEKRVCVVGCGGLGGHVIQTLARFGIWNLTLVDGDIFSTSNLNRQLFSTESNLGMSKVEATKAALVEINSDVSVAIYAELLTEESAERILSGHDLAMDCLDNISARLILDKYCNQLNIPYVHGAIAGFYGQVSSVFPGDNTLKLLYQNNSETSTPEGVLGNPPFTPQAVAAIQCSEALKVLVGRGNVLQNKLLSIDLFSNSFDTISFS